MFERRKAVKVAFDAIDVLRKYGWVQGQFGGKAIGFCALGALDEITFKPSVVGKVKYNERATIIKAFKAATGSSVVTFNDTRAKSVDDVIMAFEQSAHLIKTKQVPVDKF